MLATAMRATHAVAGSQFVYLGRLAALGPIYARTCCLQHRTRGRDSLVELIVYCMWPVLANDEHEKSLSPAILKGFPRREDSLQFRLAEHILFVTEMAIDHSLTFRQQGM